MPWRNFPEWMAHSPEWVQWAIGSLAVLTAAGVGMMAKIADDVKNGDRDRFWSRKLLLEAPAVGMIALMGWGFAEYFGLSTGQAVGVTTFMGWLGPKTLETAIVKWLPKRGK